MVPVNPPPSCSKSWLVTARPATFFQCGVNVRRLPSVAREVAAAGHEIGNHSDTHALLALKSPGFIYRELTAAQEAIEHATGVRPRYFRAPYGVRWFGLRAAQQRLGLQRRDVEHHCARLENADRALSSPACFMARPGARFSACTMAEPWSTAPISVSRSKPSANFCQN